MHIYSRDQQAFHLKRTEMEKWFSRLNTLVVGMNVVCFVTAFVRIGSAASNSMTNSIFSFSKLELSPEFTVAGCVFPVVQTKGVFQDLKYSMTPDNIGYFVSRHVQQIRFLLVIAGVHAAISTANRSCFEFNIHELRYNFVVFKKDVLTLWEILLLSLGATLVLGVNSQNTNITNYLKYCNEAMSIKSYNTALPSVELEISFFATIVIMAINTLVAAFNMLTRPNPLKELMKRDAAHKSEYEQELATEYAEASDHRSSASTANTSNQDPVDHPTSVPSSVSASSEAVNGPGGGFTSARASDSGAAASASAPAEAAFQRAAPNASVPSAMEVQDDSEADADNQILERLERQRNLSGTRRQQHLPASQRLLPPSFDASISAVEDDDLIPKSVLPPVPSPSAGRQPSIVSSTLSGLEPQRLPNVVNHRLKMRAPDRMSMDNDVATEDTVRM